MEAIFLKTDGPWLQAEIRVGNQELKVMDELSIDERTSPNSGDTIEIEFSTMISEDKEWSELFSGNPEKKRELVHIDGWRYRAFGRITKINPVTVDCGLLNIEDVIYSSDPKIVGEYISFTIERLEANYA